MYGVACGSTRLEAQLLQGQEDPNLEAAWANQGDPVPEEQSNKKALGKYFHGEMPLDGILSTRKEEKATICNDQVGLTAFQSPCAHYFFVLGNFNLLSSLVVLHKIDNKLL